MFWSKIWLFLVTAAGAAALAIAIVLPKPAERQRLSEERQRIVTACDVVNILLRSNARSRIDLAAQFARSEVDLGAIVGPIGGSEAIAADANKAGRAALGKLVDSTSGTKPSFAVLLDRVGRVVARVGILDQTYGDAMAGYFLVDDALDGFLRDDLWILDKQLYLVAASPLVQNGYVGAVLIGHQVNQPFVEQFVKQLGVDVNFYADSQPVASSSTAALHKDILAQHARVSGAETPILDDCRNVEPFAINVGESTYSALVARLPGEAGEQGAFFTVYVQRPRALGLIGTLTTGVTRADLSFGSFPWVLLVLAFVLVLAGGLGLLIFEVDWPLRKLTAEAVSLAKGDVTRLQEERHRGKLGSIARSVNIRLDKMRRDGRAQAGDLSDILGPGPAASPLPAAGPSGIAPSAAPPPPSEFKFTDTAGRRAPSVPGIPPLRPASEPSLAPTAAAAPPPMPVRSMGESPSRANTLPPIPISDSKSSAISGIVTGVGVIVTGGSQDEESFRTIFDQFVALKEQCGESLVNLTYAKFAARLSSNRDSLMAKHECEQVRFQVYIKDGKAALKATPVKI